MCLFVAELFFATRYTDLSLHQALDVHRHPISFRRADELSIDLEDA
jgi:hypothetical protein